MKLKRAIAIGTAVIALVGSTLTVSAAGKAGDYAKTLKESEVELIIDVEAYKAAYSDLKAAFGDDYEAYIRHYLTMGVYEGRTKGVLFNPLAYAEAYGDIKAAFGDDISAIVNHYVKFGAAENRTIGTAAGYADLAEAEKNGAVSKRSSQIKNYADSIIAGAGKAAGNTGSAAGSAGTVAGSTAGSIAGNTGSGAGNAAVVAGNAGNAAGNTGNAAAGTGNTASYTDSAAANTAGSAADGGSAGNIPNYHHTTSIYDDDNTTLIRVEYYDENNHLFQYSEVTNFDSSTNSYTENVFSWDEANDAPVHERTDTYVGGELSSSEGH